MQIINVPAIISVKQIIVRAEERAGGGEAVAVAAGISRRASMGAASAVPWISVNIDAVAVAAGISRVARVVTKPAVVEIGVEIGADAVAADLPFYATFLPLWAKSLGAGQGHAADPRLAYVPVNTQAICET